MTLGRRTVRVSDEMFRQVYDSPASLPGADRWVTSDSDVAEIERLLGLGPGAIGAPLWVSGDDRTCPACKRELSWLDIVSSALSGVHDAQVIATVILGEQKFVNLELPDHIAGVRCRACGAAVEGLRSFKCHNWAYAHGDIARIVDDLKPVLDNSTPRH